MGTDAIGCPIICFETGRLLEKYSETPTLQFKLAYLITNKSHIHKPEITCFPP
jgi:hypothetical protein